MSLTKFSGNNAGGLAQMWVLPASLFKGTQYNVVTQRHQLLNTLAEFTPVYFTPGTGDMEVEEKRTNEIEFELQAKIPKVRPDLMTMYNYLSVHFVLLVQDNNDNFTLVGHFAQYLLAQFKRSTGEDFRDLSHEVLSVKQDLVLRPVWVQDPRSVIAPVPDPVDPDPVDPDPVDPELPGDVIEVFSMLDFQPMFYSNGKQTNYPQTGDVTWFDVIYNGEALYGSQYNSYQIPDDNVLYYNYGLVEFRPKVLPMKSGYFRWMMDVLCPVFPANVIGFDFMIVDNTAGVTTKRYNYKVDFTPSAAWQSITIDMQLPDWFEFSNLSFAIIGFRCNKSYMQPTSGTTIKVKNLKLMSISLV